MLLRFPVAAIVLALTISSTLIACSAQPSPSNTDDTSTTRRLATFGELVGWVGPGQIAYSWTGVVPGNRPGIVVWRSDGELQRWDNLFHDSLGRPAGSFVIIKGDQSTDMMGCDWSVIPDNHSSVRASCGLGSSGANLMQVAVSELLPLLSHELMASDGERIVMDRSVPCYSGRPADEVCVDESGRVLYFSADQGVDNTVFEATQVSDSIEAFDWIPPPGSLNPSPTFIPPHDLQLPGVFLSALSER